MRGQAGSKGKPVESYERESAVQAESRKPSQPPEVRIREQIAAEQSGGLLSDQELGRRIDEAIDAEAGRRPMGLSERIRLRKALFDSFRRLGILQELLDDPSVSEIMINGPEDVFVEREGRMERWGKGFSSAEQLEDLIQLIVSGVNRAVNTSVPIADARLSDGSRVNIVLPPIALQGPTMTIRKFPEPITFERLIAYRSVTEEAAGFLKILVAAGYNIFISGGTNSGKTTFLNALSGFIPREERVITIEDSAELQLRQIQNLVRLETRNANAEGEGAITMSELIRASLRMNPSRIVVGEVRGREAMDMLQAMNTGHDGSLSTGHANSAEDMLRRLEAMVLMGVALPLPAIRSQIASALDIIVHLGRLPDRSRRVLEIVEVKGYEADRFLLNRLFVWDAESGQLKRTGELFGQEKLRRSGRRGGI